MLNDDENTSTPTPRQKRHQRIHDSDDSETNEEQNSRPQKKLKFAHVSIQEFSITLLILKATCRCPFLLVPSQPQHLAHSQLQYLAQSQLRSQG
jgi:hypothetical protein